MTSAELVQRDQQLVAMLRQDKAAFLREYRRILGLPDDAALTGLLDRDMIGAILDREFPKLRRQPETAPVQPSGFAAPT